MDPQTHLQIDQQLCGVPTQVGEGTAVVELVTTEEMAADDRGLVHLADYAAMLAINVPNVVLAGAKTRFLKPVVVGERIEARAQRVQQDGPKSTVNVEVFCDEVAVFTGEFRCYSPDQHVLESR